MYLALSKYKDVANPYRREIRPVYGIRQDYLELEKCRPTSALAMNLAHMMKG